MTNNIRVSVIVPTYNGSKTLSKTLDSIIAQTLKEIEIIVTDDCSTDNTRAIIQEYKRKYPDIIVVNNMEKNTRGSGLINRSVSIARGKYIATVDQDDWIEPEMYEKLYNAAEAEESEIADCYCRIVNSMGELIRIDISNDDGQIGYITDEKRKLLFVYPGWRLTKIFLRDFLIENNIEHCDNVCFGDNYFMEHAVAYCKKIAKVKEALYNYRVDMESITRSFNNPIVYDRIRSSELMIDSLKTRGFLSGAFREAIEFRFVELFYVNSIQPFLSRFKPSEYNQIKYIRNRIKEEFKDYRTNPYFIERVSRKRKALTMICDFSPKLLCTMYEVYRGTLLKLKK